MEEFYSLERKEMLCAKFVVFGVWSFQEQKSGLKELTGNSDWNTQQEKGKDARGQLILFLSVIIHCYRQKYGMIQSTSDQTMVV